MANNTNTAPAHDLLTIHERLTEIIAAEIEQLPGLLHDLPKTERLRAILDLLPYCAPKVAAAAADYLRDGF